RLNQEKDALVLAYKKQIKELSEDKANTNATSKKAALKQALNEKLDQIKKDLVEAKKAFNAKKIVANKIVKEEYLADKAKIQNQINELRGAKASQSKEQQAKTDKQISKLN